MTHTLAIAAMMLGGSTTAALANTQPGTKTPASAETEAETDRARDSEKRERVTKRVCKTVRLTGTRFTEEICHDVQTWKDQVDNHRDLVDDLRTNGFYDENAAPPSAGTPPG